MGMAYVNTYAVPRVRRVRGGTAWRVTYADITNRVYYVDFWTWRQAIYYATTGKWPGQVW